MIRTAAAVVSAVAMIAVAVLVLLILQEEKQQTQKLSRLTNCLYILSNNQSVPEGDPIMGCPTS